MSVISELIWSQDSRYQISKQLPIVITATSTRVPKGDTCTEDEARPMNTIYYDLGLVLTFYVEFLDLRKSPELHKTENIPISLLPKA